MVSVEELEKKLNQEELQPIYFFFGEEQFLLESSIKKIKKKFGTLVPGINYITIDETNVKEMIPNIETPAFGYEKKLILVRNAGLFRKEGKRKNADLAKIKENLGNYLKENSKLLKDSVILLFIEENEIEKQTLYKLVDKIGIVCEFASQKPIQITKRLKSICQGYHVKTDDSTLLYLIETCGTNMQELINEIRKLIEYVGENGTITKKEVDLLTTKQMQAIIFDLTDNLGKKKIGEALAIFHQLLFNKEPVQKILITLYHHFKRLYFVKLAQEEKQDIGSCLDLKPNQQFLVRKYVEQAKNFPKQELKDLILALIDLDTESKTGLFDAELGLESILCRYCS